MNPCLCCNPFNIIVISAGSYVAKKISNFFSRNSSNRETEHKEEESYPVPTYVCPLNNGSHDNQHENQAVDQHHDQQTRNESEKHGHIHK